MHRASTDEEILNYVSKKLATAQLSQRRTQSSTVKRIPQQAARPPARVTKHPSRHGSPKSLDNITSSPPPWTACPEFSQPSASFHTSSVVATSRVKVSKSARPFSWHTFAPAPPHFNAHRSDMLERQSSSYDWPGDVHYQQSPASYGWNASAYPPNVMPTYFGVAGAHEQSESSFASYNPWAQSLEDVDVPLPSVTMHDIYRMANPHTTRQSSSQQDPIIMSSFEPPSHAFRTPESKDVNKSKATCEVGEELVGLGLYSNTQDASPKQLCAALPSSFVPNGSYGTSDQPQKPDNAWQQPPEWQQSESPEASEASASPYEIYAHRALNVAQPSSLRAPQNFLEDFSNNPFLFESDISWLSNDPKHMPYQAIDLGGYQLLDQSNRSNFI